VAETAITIRGTRYPVVLPKLRDPRLGIAAVVLSIQVLGQLGLHFWVSIPQILAAMGAAAAIDLVVEFRRRRAFVWPASALLTGSGVALLMRVVGTRPDQPWATNDLLMFAGVSALAMASKYVLRYRGRNILNPSNFGLVAAFLVFGSARLEPLALWWSPLNAWMIAAYAIILVGGTYVVWRARMMTITVVFYLSFIVFQGLLAASGHCITANWAFGPVCGPDYWWIIALSPEVMIYAYFMVTDPPTVPTGRVGRIVFAVCVGLTTTLLMAPQTDEWWTKVALLGGLTLMLAARPVFDYLMPKAGTEHDTIRGFTTRLAMGGRHGLGRPIATIGAAAAVMVLVGGSIVAAGTPARTANAASTMESPVLTGDQLNPDTLPPITVSQAVQDWDTQTASAAPALMQTLAQNLAIESQALRRSDPSLLTQVDHGDRLAEMQARLAADGASGTCVVDTYAFDSVHVTLIVPFGVQSGLSLGYDASGTVTHETYDASGKLLASSSEPFAKTFAMRQATGARWMNVAVLPPGTGS
jgi:hypothetical protein